MRELDDKPDADEPTPPKKKTERESSSPLMARTAPISGGDTPYFDIAGPVASMFPKPPAGGFTEDEYRGLVPSRETANSIASTRVGNHDQNVADNARIAQAALDAHGNTPKTATDLNPTPKTPQSPTAKAPAAAPPAAPAEGGSKAVKQSFWGGTQPKDWGLYSAVELPNGRKVYGTTAELQKYITNEGAQWSTKPGVGEQMPNIRPGGASTAKAYGPGTGPIEKSNGFMGIKPGAPAGGLAYDRMAGAGTPFSERLASLHSESSDPIQQLEYRKYIERRIAEEKGTEMSDAQRAAQLAAYDYAQRQSALDPMAALQMQARIKAAPEYAKIAGERQITSDLEQQMMPILAAMAMAKDQGDTQKYNELARLLIAMHGRTAPSQSPAGMFFGSIGTPQGGAVGAEPVK